MKSETLLLMRLHDWKASNACVQWDVLARDERMEEVSGGEDKRERERLLPRKGMHAC